MFKKLFKKVDTLNEKKYGILQEQNEKCREFINDFITCTGKHEIPLNDINVYHLIEMIKQDIKYKFSRGCGWLGVKMIYSDGECAIIEIY